MALKAQGTSLSYTKKSGGTKTIIGGLRSIGEIAQTSEELDVTTLDAEGSYRKYQQGFKDGGTVRLTGYFDPQNAGQVSLQELYESGEECNWEIAFTDGTTVTFPGYISGNNIGPVDVDGAPGFGADLRITGPVDINTAN